MTTLLDQTSKPNIPWYHIIRLEKAIRLLCELMQTSLVFQDEQDQKQKMAQLSKFMNLTQSIHKSSRPTSPS